MSKRTKKKKRRTPANRRKTGGAVSIVEAGKATRFQPGQSGNLSGRPKKRAISDRYEIMAEQPLPKKERSDLGLRKGATYGDAIAHAQFHSAIEGKTEAAREIREAIEGKATQRVELSGSDNGAPLEIGFFSSDETQRRVAELTEKIRARRSDAERKS
jgi:hypothetical protein